MVAYKNQITGGLFQEEVWTHLFNFIEENFFQASSYDMLLCVVSKHFLFTLSRVVHTANIETYRKIPKISPGAYIFQRPFLRGLFLEGLIFGGAYLRREIGVSKSIGLAL